MITIRGKEKPLFTIDKRTEYPKIQQFATQIEYANPDLLNQLNQAFQGEETDEFYGGLLTGYANAYALITSDLSDKTAILGFLVAFIADKVARRGC
ncbi:MAG TPA: hypothetical protein VJI96_00605 [Candidatus Andersenbacteria bacterium]|nr:hypothetical protein [Candidatus Andersenbacteria bacterium]